MAFFAIGPDVTATLFYNAVHGGQSQASALTLPLGGEERLKQARPGRRIHSDARVGNGQEHVQPRLGLDVPLGVDPVQLDVGSLYRDFSASRHRIPGIHRQVHNDLFQLPRVGPNSAQVRRESRVQLDVLPDQSPEQFPCIRDQRIQVHHPRFEHLLPAEDEQLAGEPGGALPSPANLGDILVCPRSRHEVREQQLGAPEDSREDVVEIVRDASRQPSDGLHLLRLTILDLELPNLGQISRNRQHAGDLPARTVQRRGGQADR